MKNNILIWFLLICFTACYSQEQLKKADKLFAEYAYTEAAKAYEDYLKHAKKPGTQTVKKIADTYYYIGQYNKALPWYTKVYEAMGSSIDDTYFNRYIQTLRIEQQYNKADELLKQRLIKKGDKETLARIEKQKAQLDAVNGLPPVYKVANIAANTTMADFGTAFYGSRIVYSSSKDVDKTGGKTYKWNEQPFLELYVADRDTTNGSFLNERKFVPKDQNSYHNATLAFTPDLQTVYYSTNTVKRSGFLKNDQKGTNNLQIVKGQVDNERLKNTKSLPFNNVKYSVAHPAITADGKWLYFTSDMPGGYGETDIYVAEILENGQIGKPRNLGPVINTPQKEMFPFINDNVLYFSSNGHYGLGGLDIFESSVTGDMQFSEPQNLGKPVNSNLDDFAFIIDKEQVSGYFSSNRAGGRGDDDIYFFTRTKQVCGQLLAGTVTHIKTGQPISDAIVTLYNEGGEVIASYKTKEDGKYFFNIDCSKVLKVEATKAEHGADSKEVATSANNGEEFIANLTLVTYEDVVKTEDGIEKMDVNPIYFDLDKFDITPKAALELDRVVYVMKNFPEMAINIESHTDCRAPDDYNLTLSQNRAKATFDYITAKGIEARRIESYKGYGETRLKNKCSNDVPCTEDEHQLNRRSEFIIVKR
jgi:outer membrane protein OmpA-like peptidoglycan-associated protein/tetratricopeptide (TPR) repeat protein